VVRHKLLIALYLPSPFTGLDLPDDVFNVSVSHGYALAYAKQRFNAGTAWLVPVKGQ
jgi:hypothetical protein